MSCSSAVRDDNGNETTLVPGPLSRARKAHIQKPAWLKVKAPGSPTFLETREVVKRLSLHTVCEEARCPNIGECWSHKTATFMIMGDLCTRKCHFCAVKKGDDASLVSLDPHEPERTGIAVKELGLQHIVITSVNRDDVADMGAEHFRQTVLAIHKHAPSCRVELLIPDMSGSRERLATILAGKVAVLNHNVETVPRLYRKVRPGAELERSLSILRWAKEIDPQVMTKSGVMVGLGEKPAEVLELMDALRANGVDIMTIGQYLRPSEKQLPVREFVTPEQFEEYRLAGLAKGFRYIESGPLVRSSYHAWKHADGALGSSTPSVHVSQ
jgi:lipoic acid synthetase